MSKLRSEILFNRALLWLLFGWEVSRYGENRPLAIAYFLLAVYNVVKAGRAWEGYE